MESSIGAAILFLAAAGALLVAGIARWRRSGGRGPTTVVRGRRTPGGRRSAPRARLDAAHVPDTDAADLELTRAVGSVVTEAILVLDAAQRVRHANAVAQEWFAMKIEGAPELRTVIRSAELNELVEHVEGAEPAAEHTIAYRDRVYRARVQRLDGGGAVISLRDDTAIERLARARRDLVANISHDLRTPLTSIRLLVEALLDGPDDQGSVDEGRRKQIASIKDQATILERLADGLIQLNRIETGRALLQLSPCALADVVADAERSIEPQLVEQGIKLQVRIPAEVMVLVDAPQIRRVLTNLLDNAISVSRADATVVVGVMRDVPVGPDDGGTGQEHVEVYVQDEGPGIAPDEAERIFERFYRGDRSRASVGSGLGLAIARHIVDGHGGRIWLDRSYRNGACFRFTVPLAQ